MRAVVETLNESCSMGVLDNGDVIYIARAAPKHMMSLQINVGSRVARVLQFHRRVLLAGLNTADLAAFFKTGVASQLYA
jgi:IclR family pca regulon transcriptional regulator